MPSSATFYPIDLDVERVARRHDAVFDLDDTATFEIVSATRGASVRKSLVVVRVSLNFNWLRHTREIADQIFHQLQSLNLKAGDVFFDLGADIVHNLFDSVAREWF